MLRGSEWIKTDLHIHTKGTNKNDQFTSQNEDDFFDLFFKKAAEKDIKIIGVTDYFSIDNYKKAEAKLEILKKNLSLDKKLRNYYNSLLLVPNIELRISPVTGKGKLINIHCIFSPQVINQLEDNFFSEMKCSGQYKMTKNGITNLGKSHLKENSTEEECYKKGIEVFVITLEDLRSIKSYFKDDVLIGVANSSNDGASGINSHKDFYSENASALDEVQRQIYTIADFIFSGNPSDRAFFLGERTGIQDVISKCGGLKPCLHGSDAHTEEKLFSPDLDRYCWIKSEVSFDGIKQVINEPSDRVLIQKEKPEIKKDYNILDRVSFVDDNGEKVEVVFNQNLNTIIGGKSTGKSLLLKNIVNSIDKSQLEEKIEPNKFFQLNDFKVQWRDNINAENRNIEYFPQTYLNRLLNEENKESEIDKKAKEIMLQNDEREKQLCLLENLIKSIEKENHANIDQYFELKEIVKKSEVNLKMQGLKESVSKEVDNLKLKLRLLKNESGMSSTDIVNFDEINLSIEKIKSGRDDSLLKLKKIQALIEESNFFDITCINKIKDLKIDIENIVKDTNDLILTLVKTEETEIKLKLKKLEEKENELLEQKSPFLHKLKNQEEVASTEKLLNEENKKLSQIIVLETEIEDSKAQMKKYVENTLKNIDKYRKTYQDEFSKDIWSSDFSRLKIETNYMISKELWESIYESLNGNSLRSYLEYSREKVPALDEIKELYKLLLEEKIKLKVGYSLSDILKKIANNNYILKYRITENGNDINKMSEGNKSFVLLEMIVQLANNEFPIIIDQPEDDLDNRSIYEGLVKFLKSKKKERQIILATHNANVVIGADSENIIVANQHGLGTENKNNIKFNYKSGALENQVKTDLCILSKKTIQDHICEILEGGKKAFETRRKKYKF